MRVIRRRIAVVGSEAPRGPPHKGYGDTRCAAVVAVVAVRCAEVVACAAVVVVERYG